MFSCTPADDLQSTQAGCLCHRPEFAAVSRRLSRRGMLAALSAAALAGRPARAQPAPQPAATMLTNLRLFDGKGASLRGGVSVLVRGNLIASIAAGTPAAPDGASVIDCRGGVLMPGLIDAHWHTLFAPVPLPVLLTSDASYINLVASAEAERTLMRGFTTVRDCGGPAFALKQAIDEGLVVGPRIYPSGAMITTTGGHGDLRSLSELPRSAGGGLSHIERMGAAMIADDAGELAGRVREQLMQGASQIKLVGGGGVSSPRSPLDMSSFSVEELRHAVAVTRDWNTYVLVHAFAPHTIRRAVEAGAQCVEHGHLIDEATAALMAERGTWLSTQPFVSEEDQAPLTGPSRTRMQQVVAGTDQAYRLVRKHGVKTAFGSDLLFSPALMPRQGLMLTHLARWYSAAEALRMATAENAELLRLSGPRDPYPGRLGVVEEGAFADLLVVAGNPLEDITLLARPDSSLDLIMKDGRVHRNRLG